MLTGRTKLLTVTVLLGFAVACDDSPRPSAAIDGRPNFIILSLDTLTRSSPSAFNPDAQPLEYLDAFALESARFPSAYTTTSWTLPDHVSLLTGQLPISHGVVGRETKLPPEMPTLASLLQEAGYETVAFTDGGFLDHRWGLSKGFDHYDGNGDRLGVRVPRSGRAADPVGSSLFDRAIALISSRRDAARPFFLLAHICAT